MQEGEQAGAELGLVGACVGHGEQAYQGGDAERRRESGGLREPRSSTAARAGGRRENRVAACWCNALHSEQ